LFEEEAEPTDRLVHLCASDELDLSAFHNPFGKCSFFGTVHTNCAQFCDFFSHRYKVNDASKSLPLECTIQSGYYHNFPHVCSSLAKFYNILEELPLIDANDIVILEGSDERCKLGQFSGFFGDSKLKKTVPVVSGHFLTCRVTIVMTEVHNQTTLAGMLKTPYFPEEL
jgi:hypothetical protein